MEADIRAAAVLARDVGGGVRPADRLRQHRQPDTGARLGTRPRIALRAALGASRGRIVRQLLAESLLLAALSGAAGGVLVGRFGLAAVTAALPVNAPLVAATGHRRDGDGVGGAAPGRDGRGLRTRSGAARLAPRSARWPRRVGRQGELPARGALRNALVVVEVALAVVLLVCAGLMTRAFLGVLAVEPGFRAEGVVTMQVSAPRAAYPTADSYLAFYDESVGRWSGSRVLQVGAGTRLPSQQANWVPMVIPEERSPHPPAAGSPSMPSSSHRATSSRSGSSRLQGRTFTSRDGRAGTPGVVVINRSFVERHWPKGDPIGTAPQDLDGAGQPVGLADRDRRGRRRPRRSWAMLLSRPTSPMRRRAGER